MFSEPARTAERKDPGRGIINPYTHMPVEKKEPGIFIANNALYKWLGGNLLTIIVFGISFIIKQNTTENTVSLLKDEVKEVKYKEEQEEKEESAHMKEVNDKLQEITRTLYVLQAKMEAKDEYEKEKKRR